MKFSMTGQEKCDILYMIKFVSDLRQVSGFLWILHTRLSSTNKTDCHNITETLLSRIFNHLLKELQELFYMVTSPRLSG
jgi:hypothetical protein